MAIPPQGRSPGQDPRQVPDREPYRGQSSAASGGEAMETARHQPGAPLPGAPLANESAPADGSITPPLTARTDPHRGTGEMGTEGLDPSAPLGDEGPQCVSA